MQFAFVVLLISTGIPSRSGFIDSETFAILISSNRSNTIRFRIDRVASIILSFFRYGDSFAFRLTSPCLYDETL